MDADVLIHLVIQILTHHGPLPIGEIGKQLQTKTGNTGNYLAHFYMLYLYLKQCFLIATIDLPRFIKKTFSGLKKFISSYPQLFYFEANHNFNPKVHMHIAECAPEITARGSIPCDPAQQSSQPISQGSSATMSQSSYGQGSTGQHDVRDAMLLPHQVSPPHGPSQAIWGACDWGQQLGRDIWDSQPQHQHQHQAPGNVYRSSRPPPPPAALNHDFNDHIMGAGYMNFHDGAQSIGGSYNYGHQNSSSFFDDDIGNAPPYQDERNRDAGFRQPYSNRSFLESNNNPRSFPPPPNLPRYPSQLRPQQQQQQRTNLHQLYHSQDSGNNMPDSLDNLAIKTLR